MTWVVALMVSTMAAAQARQVARRGSEITVFGEGTYLEPAWGVDPYAGVAIGGAITPFLALPVQPSFEVRLTNGGGDVATERTFSGGLKLAARVRQFHPYGLFEEGVGLIYFKHPIINSEGKLYKEDESRIYVWGGGMEFDVRSLWQIRAEATQQRWNLNPPEIRPVTISFGVTYRIPFRNGRMQ